MNHPSPNQSTDACVRTAIPRPATRYARRPRSAFTLIELLTVIAIIGILAAIIIPVVGKVRLAARQSQCVSNLRQIGIGIMAYTNDNRGFLPGRSGADGNSGLESAVHYRFPATNDRQLGWHIGPYLGTTIPTTGTVTVPNLEEVATVRAAPNPDTYTQMWVLNSRLRRVNYPDVPATIYYPFGWTASGLESSPKRHDEVIRAIIPSRTWMVIQADRKLYDDFGANSGPFVPTSAPAVPVYGAHRNALFFDGSVARIREDQDVRRMIEERG